MQRGPGDYCFILPSHSRGERGKLSHFSDFGLWELN